jgi:hypothetical protein
MQRADVNPLVLCAPLELAVERSETVLSDLVGPSPPDFELVPRSKLLGRKLLRAPAQATRDVATVESQLLAVPVDTPHDDMRVRVPGVVVIDRRPLDASSEVLLDARHQLPHVVGQVELHGILR